MRGRIAVVLTLCLLASSWSLGVFASGAETSSAIEKDKRRVARLVAHLKRLNRPRDWRLVRKLFSPDPNVQLNALSNCALPEKKWPWYLSSGHLQKYAFSVNFVPINMDADARLENLMIIQSDHGKDHYVTFCLMDDDRNGRAPLASYSDSSRGRELTYQIADLTADGSFELVLNVREGANGSYADAVRVIKPTAKHRFDMVWFTRLQDELKWPRAYVDDKGSRVVQRSENLRARVRLRFNGPGSPATLIVKGVRKHEERFYDTYAGEEKISLSVNRFPFEEFWRWDKEKRRFVRVVGSTS